MGGAEGWKDGRMKDKGMEGRKDGGTEGHTQPPPPTSVLRLLESISGGLGTRIPCVPGGNSFSKAGSFFPSCFPKAGCPAWVADAASGCWCQMVLQPSGPAWLGIRGGASLLCFWRTVGLESWTN